MLDWWFFFWLFFSSQVVSVNFSFFKSVWSYFVVSLQLSKPSRNRWSVSLAVIFFYIYMYMVFYVLYLCAFCKLKHAICAPVWPQYKCMCVCLLHRYCYITIPILRFWTSSIPSDWEHLSVCGYRAPESNQSKVGNFQKGCRECKREIYHCAFTSMKPSSYWHIWLKGLKLTR